MAWRLSGKIAPRTLKEERQNMKKAIILSAAISLMVAPMALAETINEVFASMTGTDFDEYIEICATPGQDMSDLTFIVVEGDASSNEGTVDRVWPLTGTCPLDGFYVLGDDAVAEVNLNIGTSNRIENGTNSYFLVRGTMNAGLGDDIDLDDDGVVDFPGGLGWTIVDELGVNDGGTGDLNYASPVLGPDGSFGPAGLARCSDCDGTYNFMCFGITTCDVDIDGYSNVTPGTPNDCPGGTATEDATWGGVKALFR